jgi:NAD(P)-dependent dehydrogenase (short-subunit alcohol dehydrogenase family)
MNDKSQLFKEKVVCITGSSRGVGKKLVEYFVNEGAFVVGINRTKDYNILHKL